jgi:hypothetical protein
MPGLCVGDREARADGQGGKLIDRIAAGAPVRELVLIEVLGHTRVPFAGTGQIMDSAPTIEDVMTVAGASAGDRPAGLLKSFGWGIAALHRLMQRRSCHFLAARPIASSGSARDKASVPRLRLGPP